MTKNEFEQQRDRIREERKAIFDEYDNWMHEAVRAKKDEKDRKLSALEEELRSVTAKWHNEQEEARNIERRARFGRLI